MVFSYFPLVPSGLPSHRHRCKGYSRKVDGESVNDLFDSRFLPRTKPNLTVAIQQTQECD